VTRTELCSRFSRSSVLRVRPLFRDSSFLFTGVLANMPTKLEIERQEKIARNRKLLNDLMGRINKENDTRPKQTVGRTAGRKSVPNKWNTPPKKRVPLSSRGDSEESRPTKRARPETPPLGLRRSSRNAGKTPPDYQAGSRPEPPSVATTKIGVDHDREPNRRSGKRVHDPYDRWHRNLGRLALIQYVMQEDIWPHSRHSCWNVVGKSVCMITCSYPRGGLTTGQRRL
jgi:hypothetical protein